VVVKAKKTEGREEATVGLPGEEIRGEERKSS
jgi:hypothetical protein